MTSITGWNRIEPVARDQNFREGLEAPIYDPAWTLARQWQVGEFRGEDAASAVLARTQVRSRRVTHYIPGRVAPDAPAIAYDGRLPLESLVEAETAAEFGPFGWFDRSEAGLAFLRLLRAHPSLPEERPLWIAERGFPILDAGEAAALTYEDRADYAELRAASPDGLRLASFLAALLAGTETPPPPYAGLSDALKDVARRWLAQWRGHVAVTADRAPSWQPARLEYGFALAVEPAGGGPRLIAREYHGGAINWDDFDILDGPETGADTAMQEVSSIPMPVEFTGMPAPRWWEFEDGRLALPQVEAAPDDLIKLVLIDFALVYGGDWLILPLDLGTGALHRIERLTVTDTFGEDTRIEATADTGQDPLRDWTMHTLSETGVTLAERPALQRQVMFLPPVSAGTLNGTARETVNLGRDEVANLALAREHIITGPPGTRIDREQAYRLRQPPEPAGDGTVATRYRLAEKVPDYWIPFVPELVGGGPAIRLRRGAFLDPDTGEPVPPKGRILVPEDKLRVEEEEISRIGMTINRLFRLARGAGGETVLWPARQRKPSRADQSSGGIGFDQLKDQ